MAMLVAMIVVVTAGKVDPHPRQHVSQATSANNRQGHLEHLTGHLDGRLLQAFRQRATTRVHVQ